MLNKFRHYFTYCRFLHWNQHYNNILTGVLYIYFRMLIICNLFIKKWKTQEYNRYIVLILKKQKCYLKLDLNVKVMKIIQELWDPEYTKAFEKRKIPVRARARCKKVSRKDFMGEERVCICNWIGLIWIHEDLSMGEEEQRRTEFS